MYDPRLLFAQICVRLDETPARSLLDLSREFHVDSRTIRSVIASMSGGVKFSSFKDDILIARLTRLFVARPHATIEEVSMDLGYKSERTFARAVCRASGVTPAEFRDRIVGEATAQKAPGPKVSAAVN